MRTMLIATDEDNDVIVVLVASLESSLQTADKVYNLRTFGIDTTIMNNGGFLQRTGMLLQTGRKRVVSIFALSEDDDYVETQMWESIAEEARDYPAKKRFMDFLHAVTTLALSDVDEVPRLRMKSVTDELRWMQD